MTIADGAAPRLEALAYRADTLVGRERGAADREQVFPLFEVASIEPLRFDTRRTMMLVLSPMVTIACTTS